MPWCDECSKFWTPSSMKADGTCPTCGRVLVRAGAPVSGPREEPPAGEEQPKAPWHFKVLLAALVAYLVWRLVDLIRWVLG